jgi:hypothetical protein
MLDPQTVYLISISQYTPTFKEVREMARILHAQECSRQVLTTSSILIESNVQIGQA